jgi:hypothetical protein
MGHFAQKPDLTPGQGRHQRLLRTPGTDDLVRLPSVSFGPLVWSIVAVLVALVVLALLVLGALRAVGRTTTVLAAFTALLSDRAGMLRARVAALRVRAGRLGGPSRSSGSVGIGPVESDVTTPGSASGSASGGVLR